MKDYSWTLLVFGIILLAGGYYYGSELTGSSSCASQVTYSLGEIDADFNLDRERVAQLAMQAGDIWNQALGEEIYTYDENGPIKINFVYEQRQQERDIVERRLNELDIEYESLTELGDKINRKVASYEREAKDLNSDIEYWNSRGGAPNNIYRDLRNRENKLDRQRRHVNDLINAFNDTQTDYELSADTVNNIISQKRNTMEEAGVFMSSGDGGPDLINIYVYDGDDSLKLLLVHELGHAKAGHVIDNNYSVMSLAMSNQQLENLQPTEEDIEMVETCNRENN